MKFMAFGLTVGAGATLIMGAIGGLIHADSQDLIYCFLLSISSSTLAFSLAYLDDHV